MALPSPPAMTTLQIAGRRVAYRELGEGGVPLLLLHGYTGASEDFDPVLAGLAGRRRVVAVDFPGHGGSAGPDDPAAHSLVAAATWTLQVADALGLDEFALLGHSMGGLVAQRVAAAASQRLRALVLSATGLGAPRDEVSEPLMRMALTARDQGLEAAFEVVNTAFAESDLDPGFLAERRKREDELRARYLRLPVAAVVGGASALVTAMPLGAFLRGIDVPVLVIHGEHDYVWTPAEQALLARTIRGARRAVVPGTFHSPQWEDPQRWLDRVVEFLEAADEQPVKPRRVGR